MMSAEDLKKVRSKCGWAGCRNSFLLSSGAPKGWRSLLLFRDNEQSLNGGGLLDVMSLSELRAIRLSVRTTSRNWTRS